MSSANIAAAVHDLKMGKDRFEDFIRTYPGSKGAAKFKQYIAKIDWIFLDIVSIPQFTDEVRYAIRKELSADSFAIPAIKEKLDLCNPEQVEFIETVIDAVLKGEPIEIQLKEKE